MWIKFTEQIFWATHFVYGILFKFIIYTLHLNKFKGLHVDYQFLTRSGFRMVD